MLIIFIVGLTFSNQIQAASLQEIITVAEQQFDGVAFTAERYTRARKRFYDVELLRGRQIIEAVFDANTGNLLESEIYSSPRRSVRVSVALNRANISLLQAIDIAEKRVSNSRAIEAEIRLSHAQYLIEVRAGTQLYEVVINSMSGRVIRVNLD
jgi:uncharacterized membrane protein YkoI